LADHPAENGIDYDVVMATPVIRRGAIKAVCSSLCQPRGGQEELNKIPNLRVMATAIFDQIFDYFVNSALQRREGRANFTASHVSGSG
jgi:hypothetical protein